MHRLRRLAVMAAALTFLTTPARAGDIHVAVQGGETAKVKALLTDHPDLIDSPDENGNLPMHLACLNGQLEIAKLLLESGADINAMDREHSTPLEVAAQQGHSKIVALLLERGADVKHKDVNGMTALHFAAYEGKNEAAKLLIDHGADVNATRANGSTPLHGAALDGHVPTMNLLIERGANPLAANEGGYQPLHAAVLGGQQPAVALLLKLGADANAQIQGGDTPLGMAARVPEGAAIVALLLESGAAANGPPDAPHRPLHFAAYSGNLEMAKLLIAKGADVNAANNWGATPLTIAARDGRRELVEPLVKAGAEIDAHEPHFGRTALHWAALRGNQELARELLALGAKIDARDSANRTPVQVAAQYGYRDVVELLAAQGAPTENLEKNYGFSKLLEEPLPERDAHLWYLGHCGWAVKTKNNLLVFDYWKRDAEPARPLLANGHIDPAEIADQNVTVFVTHEHQDHFDPRIFEWADQVKNITYVYGFRPERLQANSGPDYTGPKYEYVGPRQQRSINGMQVATIAANDAGVGFLVTVDGLTIYHAGDHAGWADGQRDAYLGEIDFLAQQVSRLDFAMVNVTGCHAHDPQRLREGTLYTLNQLKPRVMIPTHAWNQEQTYREAAEQARAAGFTGEVYCPEVSGDRFTYHGGRIE